jgi:hypothetical protein
MLLPYQVADTGSNALVAPSSAQPGIELLLSFLMRCLDGLQFFPDGDHGSVVVVVVGWVI